MLCSGKGSRNDFQKTIKHRPLLRHVFRASRSLFIGMSRPIGQVKFGANWISRSGGAIFCRPTTLRLVDLECLNWSCPRQNGLDAASNCVPKNCPAPRNLKNSQTLSL